MRLGVAFLIYVALVLCASLALAAPAAKHNAALAAPNAAATPTEAERKPPASIFGVLAGHLRAYAPGRGQHATPPGAASPPDHERGQQAAARGRRGCGGVGRGSTHDWHARGCGGLRRRFPFRRPARDQRRY